MEFNYLKKSYLKKLRMQDLKNMKYIIQIDESLSISVYEGEVEKYNLNNSFGFHLEER